MMILMVIPVMMNCMGAPVMTFYMAVMMVVLLLPRAITLNTAIMAGYMENMASLVAEFMSY